MIAKGMGVMVQIFKADLADADALTDLVNQAYRPAPGAEGWTHESALVSGHRVTREMVVAAIQQSTVLLGKRGPELVGCVQIQMEGNAAHIGMLAVNPAIQTSGIGRSLLEHAETFAVRNEGATTAVLIVIAARRELIAFYLRRGYRQTGEQLRYPVEAGVGTPVEEAMVLTRLCKPLDGHGSALCQ